MKTVTSQGQQKYFAGTINAINLINTTVMYFSPTLQLAQGRVGCCPPLFPAGRDADT